MEWGVSGARAQSIMHEERHKAGMHSMFPGTLITKLTDCGALIGSLHGTQAYRPLKAYRVEVMP